MNNTITFILGVVVGTVIGGLAALLYAPQSGEELRGRLRDEASAERQRLQVQYEKSMGELHERVDKVQGDVQSLLERSEEQGEQDAETA
jgi:gas vesicle protein